MRSAWSFFGQDVLDLEIFEDEEWLPERKRKRKMRDEEEEELNQKALLEQVFGQSSSSDEDNDGRSESDSESEEGEWKSIEEVKGLWLFNDFLSPHQQSQLLTAIEAENWFTEPSVNQAMRFGHQNLPNWAIKLSRSIHRCSLQLQSSINLLQREPLFDQMIVNVYHPNEGICAHVDLLRFDDGIAIVSLESSCVMHFTPDSDSDSDSVSVPVLLTPGSLVLLFGDARYRWKHEINRRPGFQLWQGQELNQTKRTSITLRKLSSKP